MILTSGGNLLQDRVDRLHPLPHIPPAGPVDEGIIPVEEEIPHMQDFLPRKINDGVSIGVPAVEMKQLDLVVTQMHLDLAGERENGGHRFLRVEIDGAAHPGFQELFLRLQETEKLFGNIWRIGDAAVQFLDQPGSRFQDDRGLAQHAPPHVVMRDDQGEFSEHPIPSSVVPMVMGIHQEPDRLVRDLPDLVNDPRREVLELIIDDQDPFRGNEEPDVAAAAEQAVGVLGKFFHAEGRLIILGQHNTGMGPGQRTRHQEQAENETRKIPHLPPPPIENIVVASVAERIRSPAAGPCQGISVKLFPLPSTTWTRGYRPCFYSNGSHGL